MKKVFRCFIFITLVLVFCMSMTVPSVAASKAPLETSIPVANGQLVISDPSTGEQWKWDLSASAVTVKRKCDEGITSCVSNPVESAEISIDIGEYLSMTFSDPTDRKVIQRDDVILTVGLRYSTDIPNNMISVYCAYGSAPDNGMYHATNKSFYYANPGTFMTIVQYPTTESWSYETDSTPGFYTGELPPFAILDCRITVSGMESSYRDVSVPLQLSFI